MPFPERSRHPRPRSSRPRLAFSQTLDLRLERALEKLLEHRFTLARAQALRERQGTRPTRAWLGPTSPFAALVLFCQEADWDALLPDLESAALGWRLSKHGWDRLPSPATLKGTPWWSGLLAVALHPKTPTMLLLESWHPGEAEHLRFNLIWHESWLEILASFPSP